MTSTTDKIDLLLQEMSVIKSKLIKIEAEISSMETHLFRGNGRASLCSRVEVNENNLAELKWFKHLAITSFFTGAASIILILVQRLAS